MVPYRILELASLRLASLNADDSGVQLTTKRRCADGSRSSSLKFRNATMAGLLNYVFAEALPSLRIG